jgi:hypothetical protein
MWGPASCNESSLKSQQHWFVVWLGSTARTVSMWSILTLQQMRLSANPVKIQRMANFPTFGGREITSPARRKSSYHVARFVTIMQDKIAIPRWLTNTTHMWQQQQTRTEFTKKLKADSGNDGHFEIRSCCFPICCL